MAPVPLRGWISVLAPIAVRRPGAKDSRMRGLRIAAWAVAALTLALVTVHVVQVARGATRIDMPLWAEPLLVLTIAAPVAVGLMIASRRPRNVVAWIMLLAPPLLTIPVGGR